jgi:hypothetical protein
LNSHESWLITNKIRASQRAMLLPLATWKGAYEKEKSQFLCENRKRFCLSLLPTLSIFYPVILK